MFDIGFWELLIVATIALIVAGPQRLPVLAYTVGKYWGRLQRWLQQTQRDLHMEWQQLEQAKNQHAIQPPPEPRQTEPSVAAKADE